jgi:hypothetical protein
MVFTVESCPNGRQLKALPVALMVAKEVQLAELLGTSLGWCTKPGIGRSEKPAERPRTRKRLFVEGQYSERHFATERDIPALPPHGRLQVFDPNLTIEQLGDIPEGHGICAKGGVVAVYLQETRNFFADRAHLGSRRRRSLSVYKNPAFEAVEEEEDVADVGLRSPTSASEPVEVGRPASWWNL